MRKQRAEEQAEVKALAASYDRAVEQVQAQHAAALQAEQQRQEVQLTALQEQLKAQVSSSVASCLRVVLVKAAWLSEDSSLLSACKQQKARDSAATSRVVLRLPALVLHGLCSATGALRCR